MAENVNENVAGVINTDVAAPVESLTDAQIREVVDRVNKLQKVRTEIETFKETLAVREKDMADAEVVFGVSSKEYSSKKELVEYTKSDLEKAENEEKELSFKKSGLKKTLDALTKKFEEAYRAETTKEYHIQLSAKTDETKGTTGKKVFKQLLEYLYHNVTFTPKSAANLMLLVRNMEDNKAWTNSKDFDGVVILKANNVINLWRFIMDDMSGKGFYEARTFLECWVNCGQSVSDAVREIQKDNSVSRQVGSDLNLIEDEFNRSEDDIPPTPTTREEVDPDVSE